MKHLILFIIISVLVIMPTMAQDNFDAPRESGRAYGLTTAGGALQIAQFNQEFGGTTDIDYHPEDPRRWARIDNFGIIRFTDFGNPDIFEGVYTFAPYVSNFQVGTPAENKVFAREVEWSPDGQQLAFRIQNDVSPDLNQGVWFWQPLQELSTDPSYQILRHCPPFCSAAGTPDGDPGWRSTSLEWSSDNGSILIGLRLLGENRRALEIRQALRDRDQVQAGTRPNPLLYDYGHWSQDGTYLIVSGTGPDGMPVFGSVERDGGVRAVSNASDIGMAWVQDAVETLDGQGIVMLGNTVGFGAPLQIIDQNGEQLTPPIGNAAPDVVKWSPDRTAVMLQNTEYTYLATINGAVYDITDLLANNSPNIDWIDTPFPAEFTPLALPLPLAEGDVTPQSTPTGDATSAGADTPTTGTISVEYAIGALLVVTSGTVDVYSDPVGDSPIVGTMTAESELIITGGPLQDGDVIWYRIQSLDFTGWIRSLDNLGRAE